jgi:hypothetical protein
VEGAREAEEAREAMKSQHGLHLGWVHSDPSVASRLSPNLASSALCMREVLLKRYLA